MIGFVVTKEALDRFVLRIDIERRSAALANLLADAPPDWTEAYVTPDLAVTYARPAPGWRGRLARQLAEALR